MPQDQVLKALERLSDKMDTTRDTLTDKIDAIKDTISGLQSRATALETWKDGEIEKEARFWDIAYRELKTDVVEMKTELADTKTGKEVLSTKVGILMISLGGLSGAAVSAIVSYLM